MVVESQDQQPSVNVYPNGNGGNYGGGFGDMFGGMGGGAIFFWLILFFFMIMFMGWGGNNGNASGNGGGTVYIPYGAPYMMGGMGGNSIQQNFDQAAVISGINGLQTQMQTGFSNAEVSRCNQQANLLQQMNNNQNTTNTQLQNLNMGLQNCCCENRAAVADLKYTVANEACDAGKVLVNDKVARASYDVKVGDVIAITMGARTVKVKVTEVKETVRKEDAATMYTSV